MSSPDEIQAELATRNITISAREIGFLSKRFIVYLTLAHQEYQADAYSGEHEHRFWTNVNT